MYFTTIRCWQLTFPLLVLILVGCASPSQPTRFYRLDSQAPLAVLPAPSPGATPLPLLGIGPVSLASYLDRPQLVERSGGHRLVLHEFDQWAGTLQENILVVMTREMQQRLPRVRVIGYPWNSAVQPGYELVIDVSRFDRQAGKIGLQARWSLLAQPDNRLLRLDQTAIETPLAGSDMESVVAASSLAVQLLAREIASQVQPLLDNQR
jgi:uncharacterized protein